ncbi:hypothetical protein Dimus_033245 [Dionaea muscipula]
MFTFLRETPRLTNYRCSKFGEIFDKDFFIYALQNKVKVARKLPEDTLQRFDNNISNIVNLRLRAWSSPTYYLLTVLPKLLELGAVRVAPFSNILAHAVAPFSNRIWSSYVVRFLLGWCSSRTALHRRWLALESHVSRLYWWPYSGARALP